MARVAKITVYVEQTYGTQVLKVRTVGKVGSTPVNTISVDQGYAYKTAAVDAKTFWESILALSTAIVAAS